jgi:RNA polymerase sigma-70 factor (ECF subfamily)
LGPPAGRLVAVTDHADFDARLRRLLEGAQTSDAATLALEVYGEEIYGLLAALHRNDIDASEVFSRFCERLWKGLPGFQFRSSFRTWAYTIAWNVSSRFRTQEQGRREVLVGNTEFSRLADKIRSNTQSRLLRERRDRLVELRETLPLEDQTILILRVDRELDWRDLARVLHNDTELTDEALEREAARLRKRFQLIKERLRALAAQES